MPIPKLYRQPKFVLLLLVLLFGVLVAGCWYGYQKQLKNLEKQLYELQHQLQTQRCMNSKLRLFTLLLCICSFGLLAQVTPQGSLSGNTICPGAQATLTFTATAGTGPFTVRYTDGNAIRTQTGVTSGTPFNAMSKTTATKTYTLLKVTGADGGIRSGGFTDATGTVTVSARPDLKDLTLSPIAPVCAGSNAILSLSGFVQTRSFQSKPPITTLTNGALSVYSADLDGDGDMDVLSASVNDDEVAWYKNDGNGGFGPQIIISTSADFPTSVHAADLDGDGDLDVLSASIYDDKIAWYQNNGSSGFGPQNVISNSANDANSVYAADLDGDGDMDVLSASINDSKIAWYENNGSGGFGPQTVISTAGSRAQSVYAADLDGDGDMDVLSASSNDDKIAWYENNGSGGFGVQKIISTDADGAAFVTAADLDGDGDMDVLSASQLDNKVAWYENNGSGGFGAQNIISTSAGGTASVHAADLDGDGDLDVLSASGQDNKVAWYENNGSGGFGAQIVISNTTGFAYSVYAADLDGDGDMDVPVAAYHGNRIVWFENRTPLGSNATVTYTAGGGVPKTMTVPVSADSATGTLTAPKAGNVTVLKVANADGCSAGVSKSTQLRHLPRPDLKDLTLGAIAPVCAGSNATLPLSGFVQTHSFRTKTPISTSADGAKSVYAADLDGDGDMDVLSASSNDHKIAWYKNDGNGGLSSEVVISTAANDAHSVYAADLDGDGDLDVLSASTFDDKIAWYQNNGSGGFGTQQVISTSADGAWSVYATDLDGDGDLDVLSASYFDDKIAWYENDGSGGFGAQQVISNSANGAQSVYAADLDGDGDMDVLSASSLDTKIAWYQNNGSGGFGTQQVISNSANGAQSVYAADLDGDGDLDVLSASFFDKKIAWYKNNGSGGFGSQQVISTLADGAYSVYAADLDGDGDLDVLSASGLDNKFAWYENDGNGGFGAQQVISNSANGAWSVYAADMDGDGDIDVLSASAFDDKIAWYENRTPFSGNATVTYSVGGGIPQTVTVPVSAGSATVTLTAPKAGAVTVLKVANADGCAVGVSKSTPLRPLPRPDLKDLTLGPIAPVCAGSNATLSLSGFVQTHSFQTKTAISTSADGAFSVYAADLDGDGDMDVLSASFFDGKIVWYQNNGSGTFTAQPAISTEADGARSVYAADLDGDGDMDVLSASFNSHKIVWYQNDGSGTFTAQPAISTSADGAFSVYAADLDGDGDMDVLSASLLGDKIVWYENNGSGTFTAKPAISTSANSACSVYAADLDGDGDMDVLSASFNSDKIVWYQNNGSGGFTEQPAISTSADGAYSVYAVDLDGDGDMDVLSASGFDDKIAWYKNNGSGTFTAQPAISTEADGARSVYAADLDGDGDMDVLSASFNSDKIVWYQNDGSGTFTAQPAISTSAIAAQSVYAVDLDGDGDLDVLSASVSDDKIAWYENRTPFSGNAQVSYTINGGSPQTAAITVSSGSASAVIASPVSGTLQLSKITAPNGCETAVSSSTSLSVNPVSVGGTVSAPQTLCTGTSPADLTLSGQVGNVVRWEKSVNPSFSSPTPISSTSATLTSVLIGNLTADTYFRAVVKSGVCSEATSSSVLITVNLLPTATISGTTTVCRNSPSPTITFTGADATAPYTFTYKINDGAPQTVTTTSGNSVTVAAPTGTAGTFVYSLISVSENSSAACSQTQTGSATVTVNPLPTATISGTTTVCKNSPSPNITFTGSNATAPYTFTYKINDGAPQTVTTTSGNSVTVAAPTGTAGTFVYNLVSVSESSSTACSQTQTGSATVTVNPLPTATISGTTTVCKNSTSPNITFTGADATAPYTFTYKINDGAPQTVTTTSGNSVTVAVPTGTAGTFVYSLISVSESSSTACSQTQTGSATVTVNPLPTASISGTTTVCKNSPSPTITFTGADATAPYTFTYKINDGAPQTVTTTSGNSATVAAPTGTAGTFVYSLISVSENSSAACSQEQMGSATVTVNPLPTATISGTKTVCQNSTSPNITFTGSNATAPYTFTYKINDGAPQTVKTTSGNSVTVAAPTGTAGTFVYNLVSVSESSTTACSQEQMGSVEVKVQGKPTITLTTLQQTLNEGNSQVLCDIDANPVNCLQFMISGLCVVGSPVWRLQVGSGAWSDWSANVPVSQPSNNQPHRYQAACDASCPVTYTNPIEVTINYRASIPQSVSMIADGVTVNAGETKEVCNIEGNTLTFNATCGVGEVLLYSVDGGDYSSLVPMQLVDGQYHNYRVRCRKSDGTVSCVETESGVMRLRITTSLQAPVVSLNVTSGCGSPVVFSGITNCGALTTIWYNAVTNLALPSLPNQTPTETSSYYARCQASGGCLSEKSNVVTYTVIPVSQAPIVTISQDIVCTGTTVRISANCPAGSQTFWNTGVTASSFEVSFSNVTKQTYWAKCLFEGGCQSAESVRKDVYWNAFVVTLVNVGQPKSAVKVNDRSVWSSQFITRDGGPELEQSTQQNPTLYYVENANKVAPRYWTINVDACALGTDGSLTFDMLATPEMGVIRSFNTHENNAPYFMYANREGWTELYAQNHPAYGFYQDNGAGGNVYDLGLPKGLYKLGIRYWDQKGWGSIYPSTRKPQGNVLAYQEYWFRIQSKDGVGVGAARAAEQVAIGQGARGEGQEANVKWQGSDNGKQITDNGAFATVMPNPVTHTLHLKVQESKGQVVETLLMDAAGREVLRRNFVPETNTHQEEFDVSELPTGVYFMQVRFENKQETLRFVKVH